MTPIVSSTAMPAGAPAARWYLSESPSSSVAAASTASTSPAATVNGLPRGASTGARLGAATWRTRSVPRLLVESLSGSRPPPGGLMRIRIGRSPAPEPL